MDMIIGHLEILEAGSLPCLDVTAQMRFISAKQWPSLLESKVKKQWREALAEVHQRLAPF